MRHRQRGTFCQGNRYPWKGAEPEDPVFLQRRSRFSKGVRLDVGAGSAAWKEADCVRDRADRALLVLPDGMAGNSWDQCGAGKSVCGKADEGTGRQQPGKERP